MSSLVLNYLKTVANTFQEGVNFNFDLHFRVWSIRNKYVILVKLQHFDILKYMNTVGCSYDPVKDALYSMVPL